MNHSRRARSSLRSCAKPATRQTPVRNLDCMDCRARARTSGKWCASFATCASDADDIPRVWRPFVSGMTPFEMDYLAGNAQICGDAQIRENRLNHRFQFKHCIGWWQLSVSRGDPIVGSF